MTPYGSDDSDNTAHTRELAVTRLGLAVLNVLIVIGSKLSGGGDLGELIDVLFVAISLLPTVIFAIGARTDLGVKRYGSIILGLTALAWLPIAVTREAMWGLTLIPVFLASLILAILAVVDRSEESGDRRATGPRWWNPTG